MKVILRNILIFLVPLLAPLTASAETGRQAEPPNATSETTGRDTSWRAPQVMGINSARNEGRIIRGILAPMNRDHNAGDARITRAIRSYIMDTNLSFIAKDVKITTRDQHVTLNGVVESAAEHQAVIMIARIHADTDKITDELEVNSK